jgi:hypothetical protein
VALWKFHEVARHAKGICTARDVALARQVRINGRIYPSHLLAACKCVKKCVRLWLANGSTAFKKRRDETALKQVATQKRTKRERTILRICLPDSDIVLPSGCCKSADLFVNG